MTLRGTGRRLLAISLACLALAAAVSGCGVPPRRVPDEGTVAATRTALLRSDGSLIDGLLGALDREGLHAAESTSAPDSDVFGADARLHILRVDDASLQVFVPRASLDTTLLASRVDSNGTSFAVSEGQRQFVSWAGKPHFFRDAHVIVLYLEGEALVGQRSDTVSPATDQKVLRALRRYIGAEFAGID